ncbi:MAG: virulence factor SrfC family protein [Hyphomicrobiaceae bacterium]
MSGVERQTNTRDNRLHGLCRGVGETAREILDWIGDGADLVAAERVALLHEVYRTETTAATLADALQERPAVAFVGPSRAGKTQLVAALLDPDGALNIRFDGIRENINFLKSLAPDSSRYGSAVVTRLTSKGGTGAQNFPLSVRLLTMADVVKIIGAAFITGAERRDLEPDTALLDKRMQEARRHLRAEAVPGLAEEDIWDIRYYFSTRFGEEPLVRALLTSGYWETLTELVAFLSNADRARLLSVLWGGIEPFTATFNALADAVSSLACSQEARCALDATLGLDSRSGRFVRRPDSVLSAQTLATLHQPDDQSVVVASPHGQWVSVPRNVLAALIAEARLPVSGSPAPILDTTDILEFPSIDTTNSASNRVRSLARDPAGLGAIYMRAKSVYLLELYIREQAITSMVACIEPGVAKVGELAGLVAAWVEKSHGPDPAARELQASGLFLCFTKLDKEFAETARRGAARKVDWTRRIAETLHDGFGRHHAWPKEWTTTRAFDNVHLLRNPNVKAKHLCSYANDGSEQAFKPEQLERIESVRRDFIASETVRRHVADPAAVWNEAFELNDGGITYLAQSIAEVCDTRVKQRHVRNDLTVVGASLKNRLQRYHVSDDPALQQDRRRVAALAVTRRLRRCAEERRLGHLIRAVQLSDAEFHDAIVRQNAAREPGPRSLAAAAPRAAALRPAADDAQTYAAAALAHWVASVRLFAEADRICQLLQMPRASLLQLVDELIAGAARLGLEERIAAEIESLIADETQDEHRAQKAALVAASVIGDYVMWLGFADAHANTQPRRKGRAQTPIFQRAASTNVWAGGSDTAGFDQEFLIDWSQAFQALVADNVADLAERTVDAERNRRLGELLQRLSVTL